MERINNMEKILQLVKDELKHKLNKENIEDLDSSHVHRRKRADTSSQNIDRSALHSSFSPPQNPYRSL